MGWETQFSIDVHGPFYAVQLFKHENKHPFTIESMLDWDTATGYEKISAPNEPFSSLLPFKCPRDDRTSHIQSLASMAGKMVWELGLSLHCNIPSELYQHIFTNFSSEQLLQMSFENEDIQLQLEYFREHATASLYYKYEARDGCFFLRGYTNFTKLFPVCIHLHMWDYHCCYHETIKYLYKGVEETPSPDNSEFQIIEHPCAKGYREFFMDVTDFDYFRDADEKAFLSLLHSLPYHRTSVQHRRSPDVESKANHLYQREPKPRAFPALIRQKVNSSDDEEEELSREDEGDKPKP